MVDYQNIHDKLNHMVNEREIQLDRIFHALADRTRRDILRRLASNADLSISELASNYDMSLVAVSKHIKVLEEAKLVETTKEGRLHRCAMRFETLETASDHINFYMQFWTKKMDGLEKYINGIMANKQNKKQGRKEHGQEDS